jgi:glucose/arabinose dehydrogenase
MKIMKTYARLRFVGILLGISLVYSFFRSTAPAQAQNSNPPPASALTQVVVPQNMRSSPFDQPRSLMIPPNFSIEVYARIDGARFMAVTPDGNLMVSQPGVGTVSLVRPNPAGDPIVSDYVTGLNSPHDIVFHTIDAVTYVYISETDQIDRFVYKAGDQTANDREIVVHDLPSPGTPGIGGYAHPLKYIALDSQHKLYVSIGSTCNVCLSDTTSDPLRGAIYQYDADGKNGRLFARGLRNAEGLAFLPGTDTLWVVVNNRDNIRYPVEDSSDYGKLLTSYVDNHPPDEFTRVRDGGNYGWPFCNPNPDTDAGYNAMPFDRDYDLNRDGIVDCGRMDRIDKGIQAHSAPLGLIFLQGTQFLDAYRNGAVTALHGSWNRSTLTGYKVVYFPWNQQTQLPGGQIDLVSGWSDSANQPAWGRPVDIVVDLNGDLFISDDDSGTIYRLKAK